jgi:SSS family solute:Na+ symporter
MLGALAGSVTYLLMEFVWNSPLGWHAGIWAILLNVIVVVACQTFIQPASRDPSLASRHS